MDLPDVISCSKIGSASVGSSFYADDCMVWATAREAVTVKANFESISSSIGTYMNNYCLVLVLCLLVDLLEMVYSVDGVTGS